MKNKAHTICIIIMSLLFPVFAARLADWQLVHGEEYRELAAREGTVSVTTEAVRGEILDRSGKGLVTNTAKRKIVIDKTKLSDDEILRLSDIIKSCGDKLNDDLSADGVFTLADDVSRRCVSAVSEQTQGIDGVEVQTYHVRSSSQPTLAPHILGSVGAISAEEYDALSDKDYKLTDSIGKFGIEAACEDELRGKSGRRIISGDSASGTEARRGNTVWLTLDSELQKATATALGENVTAARHRENVRTRGKDGTWRIHGT